MLRIPAFLILFTTIILSSVVISSCTSGKESLRNTPAYRNRRAEALLDRSKSQLLHNEFTPAITDAVHAEMLCEDGNLLAEIHMHREYMLNRVHLLTSVENGSTLLYTLLYKRDEVFYPIDNMQVQFTFMKGSGIMNESARTDVSGVARSEIEKLSGLRTRFIIESVPVVMVEGEQKRIEELRYNFILANTGDGDTPNLQQIRDIFLETINLSVEFLDELLEDMFGE